MHIHVVLAQRIGFIPVFCVIFGIFHYFNLKNVDYDFYADTVLKYRYAVSQLLAL